MGYLKFCALRGQDPGWNTSSFVDSQSKSRLGYLKLVAWRRLGYLKFVASWSGSRFGYLKLCGFVVKIQVGIPQVLWLRGLDPGWDTSSFVASWSVSRLEHIKFCGFVVMIPVGVPQVCSFAVRNPVGGTSSLWLRGQDPGWDTFVASRSRSRLGYLKLVASRSRRRQAAAAFTMVLVPKNTR